MNDNFNADAWVKKAYPEHKYGRPKNWHEAFDRLEEKITQKQATIDELMEALKTIASKATGWDESTSIAYNAIQQAEREQAEKEGE